MTLLVQKYVLTSTKVLATSTNEQILTEVCCSAMREAERLEGQSMPGMVLVYEGLELLVYSCVGT